MSMYYILHNAKCELFSLLPEWFGYSIVKWRQVEKHESYFGRVKWMPELILPDHWNVLKCLFSAHPKDYTCKSGKCENICYMSMGFSDCSFGYNTFMLLKPVFLFKLFLLNWVSYFLFFFLLFNNKVLPPNQILWNNSTFYSFHRQLFLFSLKVNCGLGVNMRMRGKIEGN